MKKVGSIAASSLSPFKVGPVFEGELRCEIFENRWQYGKMWHSAGHIGADGQPTAKWFAFRARGYASRVPKRRPLPRRQFGFASSSYYHGRVQGYIESRKSVYVPEYAALIRDLPAGSAENNLRVSPARRGRAIC